MTKTSARVLVMLLACSVSARGASPEAKEWVKRSDEALKRGDLELALYAMRRAYEIDPVPALSNNLGYVLERLGRYVEAAGAYQRVVDDPRAAEELRAKDRERLSAIAPQLAAAPVVLASRDPKITLRIGSITSEVGSEQLASPGDVLLEIIEEGAITVRPISLARGLRTELGPDFDRASFGCVRMTDPSLRSVTIDGRAMYAPPPPGSLLCLEQGPHRIETVSAALVRARGFVLVKARETASLTLEVSSGPPPPPPPPPPTLAVETSRSAWPYLFWGAGGLVAIGGAVLIALAYEDVARIEDSGSPSTLTYDEAMRLQRRATLESSFGIGMLIAAGLSLATGTTIFVLE